MKKIIAYTAISLTLCACGGGSSSDESIPLDGTAGSNAGNIVGTTEATTDAASAEGNTNRPILDETTMAGADMGLTGGTSDGSIDELASGGENTDIGGATGITKFGIVTTDDEEPVSFEAGFYSIPQQIAPTVLLEEYRPTTDSCEVTNISLTADATILPDSFGDLVVNFISAGDVLTISSPSGSYAELVKNEQFGFVLYTMDDDVVLPAPAPANLSINIPGDDFPAFNSVAIPATDPLQVSTPASGEPFTANTTFSWVASSKPNSFIDIYASTFSPNFTEIISVDCTVIDDGSFVFPAAIRAQMGDFSSPGDIERVSVNVVQSGGAVLYVASSVERTD